MGVDIVRYLRLSRTRFNRHAEAADEIERLRELLVIATHHLHDALYSEEWRAREYCIAFHSNLEKEFHDV